MRHDLHNGKPPEGYLLIDRTSPYGNPFIIGRDGDRLQVIAKYKRYLHYKIKDALIQNDKEVLDLFIHPALLEGNIACWCAPNKPCHGDVLIKAAQWLKDKL